MGAKCLNARFSPHPHGYVRYTARVVKHINCIFYSTVLYGTKCYYKTDWLWVRSPLEELKYLLKFIFPFLPSGVKAKRGVEFSHSIRNPAESGKRSVLTLGSLCLPCCVRDTSWSWSLRYYKISINSKFHTLGCSLISVYVNYITACLAVAWDIHVFF